MTRQAPRSRGRRPTLIGLILASSFALAASPAGADLRAFPTCDASPLSRPFLPWADTAFYALTGGGDFEQPGWALHGGAQRTRGSEPYAVTGKVGNWSLTLPAGASAQSPPACADAGHPSARFFIAGTGAVAVSLVRGDVAIPAGIAVAGSTWLPSPVIVTTAPIVATASGGTAQVSVRITGVSGHPRVDDVFIDPWNRG